MHERNFEQYLDRARELADTVFEPKAQETDQADGPPADNIRLLIESGLMGLSTPAEYGGLGAPGRVLRQYIEILAGACGVTNFVQGQHQSAALLIAGGQNIDLKQQALPRLASGERLCGVAFAHIRRFGDPTLRATETSAGYILNGTAPWFTGWGVMHDVVIGATLPDRRLLYGFLSLDAPRVTTSPPMRLCAMNASGTVSLQCDGVTLPAERVIKVITPEQMAVNDAAAILAVLSQPFGVTNASIRLIRSLTREWNRATFTPAAAALERDIAAVRADADRWYDRTTDPDYKPNALQIRARTIELGVRAAHAALAASAGRGNSLDHPAQRLFREAMFYTLTAQTPDVQAATLNRIIETQAAVQP